MKKMILKAIFIVMMFSSVAFADKFRIISVTSDGMLIYDRSSFYMNDGCCEANIFNVKSEKDYVVCKINGCSNNVRIIKCMDNDGFVINDINIPLDNVSCNKLKGL